MIKRILRICRSSHGEEGAAFVELALSLPLLIFMLLGAIEFARCAYAAIEVVNAAHAAAIYAASSTAASTDYACSAGSCTGGIANAATADSGNLFGVDAVSVTSVTPSCTCANTSYTPSSCSDNATCTNNNTAMVTTVTVQTQCTYRPLFNAKVGGFSYPGPFTMTGNSTQVVSNQ
jgi:Flp pilus assembly protein TadG